MSVVAAAVSTGLDRKSRAMQSQLLRYVDTVMRGGGDTVRLYVNGTFSVSCCDVGVAVL